MADVFISYSKTRAAEAAELAEELGNLGYDVWWDSSLLPTGSFGAEIDRQLDAAKAVIVIWSPESVRSKWVRSEAAHADRQDKLVNTNTTDLDPARQVPKPFDQIHSVGLDNIRAIVAALEALSVPRSGGKAELAPTEHAPSSVAEGDSRLFAEVERDGTAAAYEYYLAELPEGRHALVARFRLKALQPASAAPKADDATPRSPARSAPTGTIPIEVGMPGQSKTRYFQPGHGKTEWFKDHEHGPDMVVVPAGSFTMGSPENEPQRVSGEGPQHKVAISQQFAVARHAVTRGQFAAFVNNTGYKTEGGAYVRKGDKWEHDPKGSWRNSGLAQDDSHPVVCVNWDDANAYAAWLAETTGKPYRLLTEAEREYVARTGKTTPFWWGSSITPAQANYEGNYVYQGGGAKGEWRKSTVPVGSFAANPWGLYNVHGNVWEWCEDVWHDTYNGAPTDGSAWLQGGEASRRVVRGGSWNYYPQDLRSASRIGDPSGSRVNYLGFRLARTLNP